MISKQWVTILLLILGLVACQTEIEVPSVPLTPAPVAISSLAQPITIGALAADPDLYLGQLLQITGQFQPQPRLVCATDPQPSPANWGLMADGYLAYVQGFSQVNSVAATGLAMTVEGRWRYWRGVVGCGSAAIPQEVYYLEVTRIIAPGAITQATLTPAGGAGELVAGLGETAVPQELPESPDTLPTPGLPATETPDSFFTPPPEPFNTNTPFAGTPEIAQPTATPTVEEKEATPAETELPPDPNSSATPPAPPEPGSTATATPASPGVPGTSTPGPSPTPGSTVMEMGSVETQFLTAGSLDSGSTHSWEVEINANSVFTAYVAAATEDIVLTLLSPTNNLVKEANEAPAGQVETLIVEIEVEGVYRLQVRTANGRPTDYAMMLNDSFSYSFVLRGILSYGGSQTVFLPEEHDHFWHFQGNAGDQIRIAVTPLDDGDPFLKFYDVEAEDVSGFIDKNDAGEGEVYDITLPVSGLYSVRVGEVDFVDMQYSILIIKNN